MQFLLYLYLSVCMSVCLSVREHISGNTCPIFTKFCACYMAMAWSSSGSVVIRYILPVLLMTSYLLTSKVARRSRPAEAQCTLSVGLVYKLCAVIPAAGQRTHGTTFRALKVSSQVATQGAESAVYDCLVFLM